MSVKKNSTKQFVEMALLVAIIILLAFTPLGYIRSRCGCGAGRGIWNYELYPVFWNEPVWNGAA